MRRRWNVWLGVLLVAAGCGGGSTGTEIVEPPEVQPFVGTWDADSLTITLDADTTTVFDLFDYNGTFSFHVEKSGTYTASLTFEPDSSNFFARSEVGTISVTGNFVTLRPQGGAPATSEFTFLASDLLLLDGPTQFDFNFDQMPDPAQLKAYLKRR